MGLAPINLPSTVTLPKCLDVWLLIGVSFTPKSCLWSHVRIYARWLLTNSRHTSGAT